MNVGMWQSVGASQAWSVQTTMLPMGVHIETIVQFTTVEATLQTGGCVGAGPLSLASTTRKFGGMIFPPLVRRAYRVTVDG